MTDVAFFLQNTQLRANRGVVGLSWKPRLDFGRGGALQPVENVHDLPFPAGELRKFGGRHKQMLFL